MSELFTITGAEGFIGSALCRSLEQQGITVQRWTRTARLPKGAPLGHVIFAAGLTADFRTRPLATAQTHVGLLADMLEHEDFISFLYLSSTRLYRLCDRTDEEAEFSVTPFDPEQLYDLTKLTGESLCLHDPRPGVRVARLSNVTGIALESPTFIASLIRDGLTKRHIELQSDPRSCKDYILLPDVVDMLPRITRSGKQRLYNLASGIVSEAGAIARRIAELTESSFSVTAGAKLITQPAIDITRIKDEFGFVPTSLSTVLEEIVNESKLALQGQDYN